MRAPSAASRHAPTAAPQHRTPNHRNPTHVLDRPAREDPPRLPEAVRRRRVRPVAVRLAAACWPRPPPTGGTGKAKSCILLWMDGGPSHKDTFDLKPDSKGAGEFKPIKTAGPGIQISEHLPKVAKLMNHGVHRPRHEHGRRRPRPGQVLPAHRLPRRAGRRRLPGLGSIVSKETRQARRPAAELRHHRRPQLRLRLPRAEAPAADRHRPEPRRREPQVAGRRDRSSTTASACSSRWRRRSTASTRPTRSPTTRRPTSGPSS